MYLYNFRCQICFCTLKESSIFRDAQWEWYEIHQEKSQLKVVKGYIVMAKKELVSNLYKLIGETLVGEVVATRVKSESPTIRYSINVWDIWASIGFGYFLRKIIFPVISFSLDFCEDCLFRKCINFFSLSYNRNMNFFELIYVDTWKAFVVSLGGNF